jgi:hypothetical protein
MSSRRFQTVAVPRSRWRAGSALTSSCCARQRPSKFNSSTSASGTPCLFDSASAASRNDAGMQREMMMGTTLGALAGCAQIQLRNGGWQGWDEAWETRGGEWATETAAAEVAHWHAMATALPTDALKGAPRGLSCHILLPPCIARQHPHFWE